MSCLTDIVRIQLLKTSNSGSYNSSVGIVTAGDRSGKGSHSTSFRPAPKLASFLSKEYQRITSCGMAGGYHPVCTQLYHWSHTGEVFDPFHGHEINKLLHSNGHLSIVIHVGGSHRVNMITQLRLVPRLRVVVQHFHSPIRLYGKAIPVTGLEGLWGCEVLRIPHCLDSRLIDGCEVVNPTHRPRSTPQKHYLSASGTHFC
jgi:hypothetical protein